MAYERSVDPQNAPKTLAAESTYYRVLGLRKLDRKNEAEKLTADFAKVVAERSSKTPTVDEFSKFGEEGPIAEQNAATYFLQGLVARLQGEPEQAEKAFDVAAKLNRNLIWAPMMRNSNIE